jgi:hypothetical protein
VLYKLLNNIDIMNYKKAIGAGLLVYAVQFSLVSVLSNLIGPFLGTSSVANYAWQGAMILVLIAIVHCVSRWYFTGNSANLKNGAYLGAILVVTNVSVTLVQAVPAIILGNNVTDAIIAYLTGVPFLLTAAITVAAATGTAYLRHKAMGCNVKDAIGSHMPHAQDDCDDCKTGECTAH